MKRGLPDIAASTDSERGPDPSDPEPEAGPEVGADPFRAADSCGCNQPNKTDITLQFNFQF